MSYLYLFIAVVAEVVGTTALARTDGFTRPWPSVATAASYAVAFYFLSLALRTIPTGLAYAIWSGLGIVAIAAIAWTVFGQRLDAPALIGLALILLGVLVINLFSRAMPH